MMIYDYMIMTLKLQDPPHAPTAEKPGHSCHGTNQKYPKIIARYMKDSNLFEAF